MKVCLIAEGSYPYTFGGVSAWVQMLIQGVPNVDFSIQTIVASRADAGECKFVIPANVVSMHDTFLTDDDVVHKVHNKTKMSTKEKNAFKSLLYGKKVDWATIFNYFEHKDVSINGLLMGKDFYDIVMEFYKDKYSQTVFVDFLWNTRSLYLLLFKVLCLDKRAPARVTFNKAVTFKFLVGTLRCHKADTKFSRQNAH